MKDDPFLLVVFLMFYETSGKEMVEYYSELIVLHIYKGTVATCQFFWKDSRPFTSHCFTHEQS